MSRNTEEKIRSLGREYKLTPRELEIVILVCGGFSNKHICEVTGMKPGTVKTHLQHIYGKTHVRSKLGLAITFFEHDA